MTAATRARRTEHLIGYADRWSVAPGETITFMVSSEPERYRAEIVRLTRGGPRTRGEAETLACERVGAPIDGDYPGQAQPVRPGSYALVTGSGLLTGDQFTLQAWICPTTPGRGRQGILMRGSAQPRGGLGMLLDETGALAFRAGDVLVTTGVPLLAGHWYLVAAAVDLGAGTVRLVQRPLRRYAGDPDRAERTSDIGSEPPVDVDAPVLIGGENLVGPLGERRRPRLVSGFNGKVDGPCVLDRALTAAEMARLGGGTEARALNASVLADWDFSLEMERRRIVDVSGHGIHGETVNSPLRAVTGHRWTGRYRDHRLSPGEYGAIHFHDDDLDDARWDPAFRYEVPDHLPSGAYAARLSTDREEYFIVFFVRPPRGGVGRRVAFLASTFTYMAYSNLRLRPVRMREMTGGADAVIDEIDPVIGRRLDLGPSLYDLHSDGSGAAHVSRLRPMLNVQPTYRWFLSGGGGWCFSGDMYLLDWLHAQHIDYDVITDEDLHEEGGALLQGYDVVLTGMHPEYVSDGILTALAHYTDTGGRLMYLGGNGFYWVTTVLPDRPHVIEIRRGHAGTRAWASPPGEEHHSNGEPGGLWRHRGRPPQHLVGVGFTAQGGGPSVPYRCTPESRDPRVAFVFEGVDTDEPIGDFGNNGGGAAGAEIDRADVTLGTPPHALVVATSQGEHDDLFQHVVEEVMAMKSGQGGTECPDVRADLTYFETPEGGAVFSVGSIDWVGSLSHNGYDNNVSRITKNVLRRFLDTSVPLGNADRTRNWHGGRRMARHPLHKPSAD
ncbi:LamG domain-containing protein [Actinomadura spongiicola]|uniref:LamG domain-containing protein n=1 Tax=Actinomadura spongiicola TaxID=2303421 RepID=A0A372GGS4_9ACTN|nr:LamG domain-containing protein [Actinomadura spongiicola]RFS84299.1 LamG domain-containing protein [Actinomadura spongiicola]